MATKKIKRFIRWIIFFAIIAIAFITNPDKSTHIDKINDKLFDLLPQKEKKSIIKTIGRAVSDTVLDKMVSVDNYYVFSISKIEIGNKSETIGYGLFGTVIFTEKIREIDF